MLTFAFASSSWYGFASNSTHTLHAWDYPFLFIFNQSFSIQFTNQIISNSIPKKTSITYITFQWVPAKNWHHGLEQGVIMNHIALVCTKVIHWNCLNIKNVYLSTLMKDPCYHPPTIALHILMVFFFSFSNALHTLIINH